MPLSEHEQRLLDQIERALYAEDPKFATTVRSTDLRTHSRRRMRRAGALFALGFVLLLVGVGTEPVVGITGFVVMLLGLVLALTAWKRMGGGGATLRVVDSGSGGSGAERKTRTRAKKAPTSGSAKERLEERWKRRWDERGGQQ